MTAHIFRNCVAFASLFLLLNAGLNGPRTASGATISVTLQDSDATVGAGGVTGADNSNHRPPTPGSSLTLTSGPVTLSLGQPTPDSIERALNYQSGDPPSHVWTVTADNAVDYNLDWTTFQDSLNGINKEVILRFGSASAFMRAATTTDAAIRATGVTPPYPVGFANFKLEEIRVFVDYYFWHDVLVGMRAAKIRFEIDGSGIGIPEPSSVILASLLALSLIFVSGRPVGRFWNVSTTSSRKG